MAHQLHKLNTKEKDWIYSLMLTRSVEDEYDEDDKKMLSGIQRKLTNT